MTKKAEKKKRHIHAITPHENHTRPSSLPSLLTSLPLLPPSPPHLRNIKQLLHLDQQLPLLLTNIAAKELLERINTLSTNRTIQRVVLLQVATVHGLIGPFDLDRDGRLALFADLDLLVVALDGGAVVLLVTKYW